MHRITHTQPSSHTPHPTPTQEKFKQNPIVIDVEVDPEDLGYDPSTVAVPFEELLDEATRDAVPSRLPKRGRPTPSALLAAAEASGVAAGAAAGGEKLLQAAAEEEEEREKAGVDA